MRECNVPGRARSPPSLTSKVGQQAPDASLWVTVTLTSEGQRALHAPWRHVPLPTSRLLHGIDCSPRLCLMQLMSSGPSQYLVFPPLFKPLETAVSRRCRPYSSQKHAVYAFSAPRALSVSFSMSPLSSFPLHPLPACPLPSC